MSKYPFIEIKSRNSKLTQKKIKKEIGYSDSTIEKYRGEIIMTNTYKRVNNKRNKMSS